MKTQTQLQQRMKRLIRLKFEINNTWYDVETEKNTKTAGEGEEGGRWKGVTVSDHFMIIVQGTPRFMPIFM